MWHIIGKYARTELLILVCIGGPGSLAILYGFPNTPATQVLHFCTVFVLHIIPLKDGDANRVAEVFDIEDFAEGNGSDIATGVRWKPVAYDGYTLCDKSKINEVGLEERKSAKDRAHEREKSSYICHDIVR